MYVYWYMYITPISLHSITQNINPPKKFFLTRKNLHIYIWMYEFIQASAYLNNVKEINSGGWSKIKWNTVTHPTHHYHQDEKINKAWIETPANRQSVANIIIINTFVNTIYPVRHSFIYIFLKHTYIYSFHTYVSSSVSQFINQTANEPSIQPTNHPSIYSSIPA